MTPILTTSNLLWFISTAGLCAQTCAPPPKDLSAWVTFDEPLFEKASRVAGQVGRAIQFDGKSQYFEMPPTPGFQVGEGDFTIELWVRTKLTNTIRNIVDFRSPDPLGWLIYFRRGGAGFQVAGGVHLADVADTSHPINDGKWHHVAAVGKRLPPQPGTIYVDGVRRIQAGKRLPLGNLNHQTPLWLGRHHRNAYVNRDDVYFEGAVDELSVYRRALSATEIAAIHKAGRAGKCRK